jgi:hypothetical protein
LTEKNILFPFVTLQAFLHVYLFKSLGVNQKLNVLLVIDPLEIPSMFSARWTMPTKSALTPSALEEQIQAHVSAAANRTSAEPSSEKQSSAEPEQHNHLGKKESSTSLNCQPVQARPSSSDSKQSGSRPSKTPSTDRPMSLKNLQEMASLPQKCSLMKGSLGSNHLLHRELGARQV